ncbi:MAG: UDP-N-acetylmuramoyl-L-alanine--D-glutamate ligase [Phycisphaerales bacterium]
MDEFSGKTVLVMGLGRFGGGLGVTRWLCGRGATVVLTDLAGQSELGEPLAGLRDLVESGRLVLRLGGHDERDFATADLVVANPAVPSPWTSPFLAAAARAGRPITTEIRLAVERLDRERVIGITGTAGKSTTSAMTAHILAALGRRVRLGGNIGGSLLNDVEPIAADELVVLELSSFMLHWLGERAGALAAGSPSSGRRPVDASSGWSPHWAAITNIAPNHLDWHGSFEHYRESKLNILRDQRRGDLALVGDGDPEIPREIGAPATTTLRPIDLEIAALDVPLRVPGAHNRANARLAVALAIATTGCSPRDAADALHDFAGLPHRLELVVDVDGRRVYNDSKSTTPDATLRAIGAFEDPSRLHLIAGGYDKGADLAPIAAVADRLGGLYTIGATGRALAGTRPDRHFETLDRAVEAALARLSRGDVLLLSPGCASWDQFINYEKRGERFAALVKRAMGAG